MVETVLGRLARVPSRCTMRLRRGIIHSRVRGGGGRRTRNLVSILKPCLTRILLLARRRIILLVVRMGRNVKLVL
jgi:hypothetical protein